MKGFKKVWLMLTLVALLTGCGAKETPPETMAAETVSAQETGIEQESVPLEQIYAETHPMEISGEEEVAALEEAPPAAYTMLTTEAPGTLVFENAEAIVDYSNTQDGYVMVKYIGQTEKRIKVRVQSATTYTYNLQIGQWETFPLSDGNGTYKVTVYRNTTGKKYATMLTTSFDVSLSDEFAPFLRPNQYVDHVDAPQTVEKAKQLMEGMTDNLEKVAAVYDFVVDTLSYDYDKAATVKSGYLPVLDEVLAAEKGICFDYAALMAGMLRSQGVPCKLVVGYAGKSYHAWINVWTEEFGWIDGVIYFDGTMWHRMDPTFASSSERSDSIMKFISNDKNYSSKYFY